MQRRSPFWEIDRIRTYHKYEEIPEDAQTPLSALGCSKNLGEMNGGLILFRGGMENGTSFVRRIDCERKFEILDLSLFLLMVERRRG